MPRERIAMLRIKKILSLRFDEGCTHWRSPAVAGWRRATCTTCQRAPRPGPGWPLPAELDVSALHERPYGRPKPSLARVPQLGPAT